MWAKSISCVSQSKCVNLVLVRFIYRLFWLLICHIFASDQKCRFYYCYARETTRHEDSIVRRNSFVYIFPRMNVTVISFETQFNYTYVVFSKQITDWISLYKTKLECYLINLPSIHLFRYTYVLLMFLHILICSQK